MSRRTIYVAFSNLSFNAGKLNSGGLVQADGVIHGGSSYLAPPPFCVPTDGSLTGIDEGVSQPVIAHTNLSQREDSVDFTVFLHGDGAFFHIAGTEGNGSWPITAAGTINSIPEETAGGFAAFGVDEVFAAGHDEPVQICRDVPLTTPAFEDCFTSADKPNAKYVAVLGERLLFANIGIPSGGSLTAIDTAIDPDPHENLVWWGASNNARVIGNVDSHPKDRTGFKALKDDYGDITGLASGKVSAVVFKKRAVYAVDIGGPFQFSLPRIAAGIGTSYSHSITELADDTYFWSNLGPAVLRDRKVLLLGGGNFALRDMFNESPLEPNLEVLSAASDLANGLVCWLIKYRSFPYTHGLDNEKLPFETAGAPIYTYSLLVYNAVSNQLSFAWKQQSANGILMVSESDPHTPHRYLPLCLVDRVPWNNPLPLSGIGLIAVESSATEATAGNRVPKLFLAGTLTDNFTPSWLIDQNLVLTTGLIPFNVLNARITAVRPILRTRKAHRLPDMSVTIRTSLSPFGTERVFGPFLASTNSDPTRRGEIMTNGVSPAGYASITLEINFRTADPLAYAYLINEIEGVEVIFADGGRA